MGRRARALVAAAAMAVMTLGLSGPVTAEEDHPHHHCHHHADGHHHCHTR